VLAVNQAIADNPALVNSDPLGEGWFVRLALADAAEAESLMDEDSYTVYCEGLD